LWRFINGCFYGYYPISKPRNILVFIKPRMKKDHYSKYSKARPTYFLVELKRARINQGQFVCFPRFELKPLRLRSNNAINYMTICCSCSISAVSCTINTSFFSMALQPLWALAAISVS
jgi:hypothetical protein